LESDVWLTADDTPVLVHDGVLWHGRYRVRIRDLRTAALPLWLPTLPRLYADLGTAFDLSLDLKDPDGAEAVLAAADGVSATDRLWLCASVPVLRRCRQLSGQVRLANSTRLGGQPAGPLVRRLADEGIDALNLRAPEWTPVRVEMSHAAGRLAFAWDAQQRPVLDRLLADGCDAIYSDHIPLLLAAQAAG
jgi:glycerophosphoryl diester phosphodiesterase